MSDFETITIADYLSRKGIEYKERNGELITKCLFSDCDADSKGTDWHLYFSSQTGQYDCKKCGAKGNTVTLAQHFGDSMADIALNPVSPTQKKTKPLTNKLPNEVPEPFDSALVEKCHKEMPPRVRKYLNARGIPDSLIDRYKLGFGKLRGRNWITIPIADQEGNCSYLKLRQDPEDTTNKIKYCFYPKGANATLFGWDMISGNNDYIFICEGEFDRLVLEAHGVAAITSTAGAGTFKEEWASQLAKIQKIYICLDRDKAGKDAAEKMARLLEGKCPKSNIYQVEFPDSIKGKDVTDYFIQNQGTVDGLFSLAKSVGGVDINQLKPMTSEDLIRVLGLTIKQDEENKLTAFLCQLSAYTEESQFNISFNAPSSTGKSYIPTEVSKLFPKEDVIEIGYCSPTAFFHDTGTYDKERNCFEIDLSRKILIFLDQPHTTLLERLRPLLSHDKKVMHLKITDKSQKGGLKTKNVFIKGYPAVIFCSAGLQIDEQEGTRFLLLSPDTNQEKLREGILEKIRRDTDITTYSQWLNADAGRKALIERIRVIKAEGVDEIKILDAKAIEDVFFSNKNLLKPRHQRDIGRLICLTKIFALLNLWFREREGNTIIATKEDINEAVKIWEKISTSQEYNLPPFIYNLYLEVILPVFNIKNSGQSLDGLKTGVTRQEIAKKHYEIYGRMVPDWQLRQQIIPMLETAGLIAQDQDPNDKRKTLIYPTIQLSKPPQKI